MSIGRYIYRYMITPYLPPFRTQLAAYGRRVRNPHSSDELKNEFSRFIPQHLFDKAPTGTGSRERLFPRKATFWHFIWQALQPNTACRAVVRKIQAETEHKHRTIDESTSAYCQARQRLPLELVQQGLEYSAKSADRMAKAGIPGWKRSIQVVDVTSFQAPDTPSNAKRYKYPTGQKKGCGFPVMRAAALFSLASGAIKQVVTAACYTSELPMFKSMWAQLKAGDILLGDRMFGCFTILAALPQREVDVVVRLNQARKLELRNAKKLGSGDWLTTLPKPQNAPSYMKAEEWNKLPETIAVRILQAQIKIKGFRSKDFWIATTLLDPTAYTKKAIASLYFRRWQIELSFRDLKSTLGMGVLRCRTPEMVEKEIRMHLIAYNFLRALMAEAATTHNLSVFRISFKGTVDTVRSFHVAILHANNARQARRLRGRILSILYEDRIPLRQHRSEPRAIKKRPKPYQWLTQSRKIFKTVPHRGKARATRPQMILT